MKYKKILIAALILVAILTVSAVSASDDADMLAESSNDMDVQDDSVVGNWSWTNDTGNFDIDFNDSGEIVIGDVEGNFSINSDQISTSSGGTTFASLNLNRATEGRVIVTTEDESPIFEKNLGVNDFYQNGGMYSYDILVRGIDFDNLDNGVQFLNFRFYNSDSYDSSAIYEVYQVDYNKNNNNLILYPEMYMEIYNGLITEDTEGPVVVVYAQIQSLSNYEFTIVSDDYQWGYYSTDLTRLTYFNKGIYSKNHEDGWAYYGITAARLMNVQGFDESLDGKTLDFTVYKLQYGHHGDIKAQKESPITFTDDGFYFGEGNDEPDPTLIFEVYGTEYYKISYDNGIVFAMIVSGDERTGKWLPVDRITNVTVRVESGDGEIEFLNLTTLGSLNYTVVPGSMGLIEHMFTLSELNNLEGLNDGDTIIFYLQVPPYPEQPVEYTAHFEQDGIVLTFNSDEDEAHFDVNDKVFKDNQYEQVFALNITENQRDELANGKVKVTSDDGQVLFTSDYIYDMYYISEDDRLIHWFLLGDLNYFSNLENGDIIYLTLWEYNGAVDPLIQKRYIFTYDNTYIYLEEYEEEDYPVEFAFVANIADDDVVVMINPAGLPQYLSDDWMVNITVDVWGHKRTTVWDSRDLEVNDHGYFEFTASDLCLDEIMWDISMDVECDISVVIYDDEQELLPYESTVGIYTIPSISKGDVVLDDEHPAPVILFKQFDHLQDIGCEDEFLIIVMGSANATNIFRMSEMDQYWDAEEGYYMLYLSDLGITQIGDYDVVIIFNYYDVNGTEQSLIYSGSFEVVDFEISVPYGEGKAEDTVDDISSPIFRIMLPANTTDKVRVYVNGTKVMDKNLADIGTTTNPMGAESFAIFLNDLQITETDKYNVRVEVLDENNQFLREASTDIWVIVSENRIEFCDILYFSEGYIDSYLGTPIAPDSEIVLVLNGRRAGVGKFTDIIGFAFELADEFTDCYYNILPGDYEAQAIVTSPNGNQTIGYGSFSVLDDSGDAEIGVFANGTSIYLQIEAPQPEFGIESYRLVVMVDPMFGFEEPEEIVFEGDDLYELLDNQPHLIYLGNYEMAPHIVWVQYRSDAASIPLEYQDYFLALLNVGSENQTQTGTILTASDVNVTYGEEIDLMAYLTEDYGLPITFADLIITVDGSTYTVTTGTDGFAVLVLYGLEPGTYDALIKFEGDYAYDASNCTASIVVNKLATSLTASDVTANYKDGTKLVATLTDANGNAINGSKLKIVVPGKLTKYITTDANGQVSLDISNLDPGSYDATITFVGDDLYNKATATSKISIINKVDTVITADDVIANYKVSGTLVATLTDINGNAISGAKLKIVVPGKLTKYITTDANGQVSLNVFNLDVGTYEATITFVGDDSYNKASTIAQITVTDKVDTVVTADDVIAKYKVSGALVATLTDVNGNAISGAKLKIVVPGKLTKYITTDANGQVSLNVFNLDVGTYEATITFVGDDSYNKASTTAQITVTNKTDTALTVPDVTVLSNVGGKLIATLTDDSGNAISGAKLKIVLNKVTKYITTDANGQVSMNIANLDVGTYAATVTFVATDVYNKATATANVFVVDKMDTVLTVPDVIVPYKGSGILLATLKDSNGNAISGAKLKIVLNKVTKYITTDANGQVSLSLNNLDIGNYTATVTFVATDLYNKATATAKVTVTKMDTVISASDITVIQQIGDNLVVTLKDANGNAISGAKLKIVLNKVTKYITTDANGQVSMKISNLDIGTYTATITFVATDLYNKATATAKVFVVEKMDTTLTAPDVTASYQDGSKLVATLNDANGNAVSGAKLKIVLNKVTKYITTDASGQVALSLSNLNVGSYTAAITFVATDLYNRSTANAKVTIV